MSENFIPIGLGDSARTLYLYVGLCDFAKLYPYMLRNSLDVKTYTYMLGNSARSLYLYVEHTYSYT